MHADNKSMKIHILVNVFVAFDLGIHAYRFKETRFEPTNSTNLQDIKNKPASENYTNNSASRPEELLELVRVYTEQHSAHVLMAESDEELCQRKFVTNHKFSFTCKSLWNNLGSIVNTVVYAVVLNRTFLARETQDLSSSCHGYLYLFPWVPTVDEIRNRLKTS